MMRAGHHRLLYFPPAAPPLTPPESARLIPAATTNRCRAASPSTSISPSSVLPAADSVASAFQDYQLLFSSQRSETADPVALRAAEGAVPADFPRGTYYLVGPGMIADDHGSIVSPFDGHGYLRAFEFTGAGRVMYSARYVETAAALEEREAETGQWRFVRPGIFSLLNPAAPALAPGDKIAKNVANTAVLSWGGRIFCLWEGGRPVEIDPSSLATIGEADLILSSAEFGRSSAAAAFMKPVLRRLMGMAPKRILSHYKIDVKRDRLLLLSCDPEDMFLSSSTFTFYEFDGKFELKQKKEFVIPDQLMIHDWGFTDGHYILMANRTKLDLPGSVLALSGMAPMISTLSVNPSQATTPIYLLPRFSNGRESARDWRIPIKAPSQLWTSHMANAFEEDDGAGNLFIQFQASVCSYKWFNFGKMFGYDWRSAKLDPSFMNMVESKQLLPHLVQISIELDANGSCQWCSVSEPSSQWNRIADFPVINLSHSGQKHRFLYASSTSGSSKFLPHFPYDTILKMNCSNGLVESWRPGSRRFIGEPIFIPKVASRYEEDGYVVFVEPKCKKPDLGSNTLLNRNFEYAVSEQRCYLVILDAKRIGHEEALVTKLEVPHHLTFPLGFHGIWDGRREE
ncbi:Carotenoid cleavage dioxygenase 7, chloroplastic [Apostasia shenzhenica]|uniref:Carotenoid cleavage dioxygenase 7, chloroplastic n=1 Tax=Apostasia shenzhenica TaxID=1088818 RepID=A0A2I0AZY4_9ASPA|nr:Carotenoid cleavage dioxygenase 7, chloroplastic [Apostasia shenzhenica]